jgi:hypothetical protein
MQLCRVALVGAFVAVGPSFALAAAQPLRVLTGQVVKACAKRTMPPIRDAVMCSKNIEVSGGAPKAGGYSFRVKEGTELPPGVVLMAKTGVITATRINPPLPRMGSRRINVTVSDGTKTTHGFVTLEMNTTESCSCPDLTAGNGGFLMPEATANQPYGRALPVVGPPSDQALRPKYTWALRDGPLPQGMTLDKTTGVIYGKPPSDAANHALIFKVKISEEESGDSTPPMPGPYILEVN